MYCTVTPVIDTNPPHIAYYKGTGLQQVWCHNKTAQVVEINGAMFL